MENPKFQIFMGSDEQFYFVLKAANSEPIRKSEMYTTEQAREDGVESVKENAPFYLQPFQS